MNVIEARDLGMRYSDLVALDGVSLVVPEGSIYALLGPNGAGKTTLIDILMNLRTPTVGAATILGTDSRELEGACLEQIGYVSEEQQFAEWMTVSYFFDYLRPFYPGWDQDRARELLDQFHLPADRKLRHLSRGMRMKASLASSMAYRPRLLILDEPFSGLDPLTRDELIEALLESSTETTVVLSSHDLPEIETFVTHVCYLDQGRVGFAGELSSLTQRFRRVSVTLNNSFQWQSWPARWIGVETLGTQVRFVDTDFDPARSESEIVAQFGDVEGIEVEAMTLRSIFISLARSRNPARPGGDA